MPAESILGGISQEETLQLIASLLTGLANNQPIYSANGQNRVTIESGSVGIAANQTMATVTSVNQYSGQPVQSALDASNIGYLYDNLRIS